MMCEIPLDQICRLCLKESFTLRDIYSHSSSGEPIYKILNFIYELEICQDDCLSSKICTPCLWKMIEFEVYKRNVHLAKVEMLKLIGMLRNDSEKVSIDENNDGMGIVAEDILHNDEDKVHDRVNEKHADIIGFPVKDEIEIEEWTMPEDLLRRREITEFPVKDEVEIEESTMPEDLFRRPEITEGVEQYEDDNNFADIQYTYEEILMESHGSKERSSRSSSESDTHNLREKEGSDNSQSVKLPASSRKGFICDICKKTFACKRDIRDHVRVHYNDKPFICEHCGKGFKQSYVKRIHELSHIKQEQLTENSKGKKLRKKSITCSTCGNQYTSKKSLYKHSIKHTNKFSCHLCDKRFSSKANLEYHISVHSKEKSFVCKICQKSFNRKCNMLRHVACHTDVKAFHCSKCNKKFKIKHHLERHELFHFQQKPLDGQKRDC